MNFLVYHFMGTKMKDPKSVVTMENIDMGITIEVLYNEGDMWTPLNVMAYRFNEMLKHGMDPNGKKIIALKDAEGRIYDFILKKWRDQK
jgi:hypothetical protein